MGFADLSVRTARGAKIWNQAMTSQNIENAENSGGPSSRRPSAAGSHSSPSAFTCFADMSFLRIRYPKSIRTSFFTISPGRSRKQSPIFLFSVAEIALYASIAAILFWFIKMLVGTVCAGRRCYIRKKQNVPIGGFSLLRPLVQLVLRLSSFICVVVSAFVLFGGINYTSPHLLGESRV